MRALEPGETTLAVHEWGPAEGPPILFWHALGPDQSGAALGDVADRLALAGFRVVAVDGPGFGDSPLLPAESYALDELGALAHRVVRALDLEPLIVMGHSWGGAVMVRYAAAHVAHVRALVLLDSGHIDYADLPDVDATRSAAAWVEQVRANGRPRPEAHGRAMHGMTARISDAWPALADVPILLLLATEAPHGDQNREHIGRFEQALPNAEIRWVEGAGHGLIDDIGPALGDEIAAWLRAHV